MEKDRFIRGKIDSMRKQLPCRLNISASKGYYKMLLEIGKYPTLHHCLMVTEGSKLTLPKSYSHLLKGPLSIRFKIYATKTMKVKLEANFSKFPAPVILLQGNEQTSLTDKLKKAKFRENRVFDHDYFCSIHLNRPGKPYVPPIHALNYVKKNVELHGKKDPMKVTDHSEEVLLKKFQWKKLKEDMVAFNRGFRLMKEHQQCQKQFDKLNYFTGKAFNTYMITAFFTGLVLYKMRDLFFVG